MSAPERVSTVLGDSRPVTFAFEDGSFTCPWCSSAVAVWRPSFPACENPGCDSAPFLTPAALRDRREQRSAAERERDEWRRIARVVAETVEEARREEAERLEELVAEAKVRGACPTCALRARVRRFVRHRGQCPRERRKR